MEASHARSLTAYFGLCAAAVVVLSQGVGAVSPGSAIARAGEPAPLTITRTVTLSAAAELAEFGMQIGAAVAQSVAPSVGLPAPAVAGSAVERDAAPQTVAPAPVIAPVAAPHQTAARGNAGGGHAGAQARKAQRAEAKAERAAARADAKASKAADKAAEKAAKAPGKGR